MKINLNSSKLQARLKKADEGIQNQIDNALEIIAMEGARNIVQRGNKGKGYAGSFKPYSPAYAKFRQKKGRGVRPVDLNFTGQMWAALKGDRVKRGLAEISFIGKEANTKGYFNNQKRPFFGFNNKDIRKFVKFFEKQIKI